LDSTKFNILVHFTDNRTAKFIVERGFVAATDLLAEIVQTSTIYDIGGTSATHLNMDQVLFIDVYQGDES
jgi:hypothetical protein